MTDADALLAAVAESPDDDLPRLVYADWLEERGDAARAEFIRLQCEAARAPSPELRARADELLGEHAPAWRLPVRGQQTFRRGFVESLATSAERLLAAPHDELTRAPLRHVRLIVADHFVGPLAELELWRRVESLDLANNHLGAHRRLRNFLTRAPLDRLQSLSLYNNRLWGDAVGELARCHVVRQLDALNLSGNPIGDAGFEELCRREAFGGLRELRLHSDELMPDDCLHGPSGEYLARSEKLTRLRRLDLAGHYLGDAAVIDIVRSDNSRSLVWLDVSDNELGALGVDLFRALVETDGLGKLRRLGLGHSEIPVEGLRLLTEWPRVADGLTIDLTGCELGPMHRELLAASPVAGRFTGVEGE